MKDKKTLWVYVTYFATASVIVVIGAVVWGLFSSTDTLSTVKILADCFSLPGILFIGMAVLGWVASKGTFDIFGYSMRGLLGLWNKESYYKQESFYDYRAKKNESRKPFNLPMLVVGAYFLLFGVIMTIVFLMMD